MEDTNNSNSNQGTKGLLGKIRNRRNTNKEKKKKVWSPRRRNKKLFTFEDDAINGEPNTEKTTSTRRVIKATRPPSPTTDVSSISTADHDIITSMSFTNSTTSSGGSSKLPTIQNEKMREKTEQWRKEKIDASMAHQKLNKEKEIMQHRMKSPKVSDGYDDHDNFTGGEEEGNGNEKKERSGIDEMQVSDIFKTRTFHPEHKRKATSYDYMEKKTKFDEHEEKADDKDEEAENTVEASNLAKVPKWMTFAAPAAFVAVCAVIMMKVLRKR
jgi:hypothetical protein